MAISYHAQECSFLPSARRKISGWIKAVILAEGYQVGDIAYIFCSPDYHLNINKTYLNHDYNTDVITFDYSDLNETRIVSGDIFIDPTTVCSNAGIVGTPPAEELMRVIVHGVLHLCGYGDKTPDEEIKMHQMEDKYLALYRELAGEYPPFDL